MIRTEHLKFQYKANEHTFSFPDIDVKQQDDLLIVGRSGIGKTTFLHLLAGILKPIDGSVMIEDKEIGPSR